MESWCHMMYLWDVLFKRWLRVLKLQLSQRTLGGILEPPAMARWPPCLLVWINWSNGKIWTVPPIIDINIQTAARMRTLHDKYVVLKTPNLSVSTLAMENHHFQWENPLFLWPFSIAICMFTRPGTKKWRVAKPSASDDMLQQKPQRWHADHFGIHRLRPVTNIWLTGQSDVSLGFYIQEVWPEIHCCWPSKMWVSDIIYIYTYLSIFHCLPLNSFKELSWLLQVLTLETQATVCSIGIQNQPAIASQLMFHPTIKLSSRLAAYKEFVQPYMWLKNKCMSGFHMILHGFTQQGKEFCKFDQEMLIEFPKKWTTAQRASHVLIVWFCWSSTWIHFDPHYPERSWWTKQLWSLLGRSVAPLAITAPRLDLQKDSTPLWWQPWSLTTDLDRSVAFCGKVWS